MALPFVMIDGYNLLHAAGLARVRYGPGDLERCRHRLHVQLADLLTDEERVRCTIVFDAQDAPPDLPRKAQFQGMTILFADPGQDADAFLEILIATHSASRQILLISSDHRLQRAIRKKRGRSMDSDKFWQHLQQRDLTRKHVQLLPKPPSKPDPFHDLNFWMTEFGAVDAEELREADIPATDALRAQPSPSPVNSQAKTDVAQPPVAPPVAPHRMPDPRWNLELPQKSDWDQHVDRFQNELDSLVNSADWLNEETKPDAQKKPKRL